MGSTGIQTSNQTTFHSYRSGNWPTNCRMQ